jgi:uncharacterized damage-inducible protein DinB
LEKRRMSMRKLGRAFLAVWAIPASALAQIGSQDNPISAYQKEMYTYIKGILLNSAEKMPDENYAFRPTDSVRSYGQLVGHVADAQYSFCSIALGKDNPRPDIEKTKTTKPELIAALKQSFAYCDEAYDALTDATAAQPVKLLGKDAPRLGALEVNLMHDFDHYGNLATYLRLKGIVPPTSEQPPQAQPQQPPKKHD